MCLSDNWYTLPVIPQRSTQWLFFLLLASVCEATVLRVPIEFPTIQGAMNSVLNGDTILVAEGNYAEALYAPNHSFLLLGNVPADTNDIPRATVDPSSLPGADTLTCLTIPAGANVTIQNFHFRNGPAMFPRGGNGTKGGGIICLAPQLIVCYCVFDSVFNGISAGSPSNPAHVMVSDSRFLRNSFASILAYPWQVSATRCTFSGTCFEALVYCGDSSSFNYCIFRDGDANALLAVGGSDLVVDHCIFGPSAPEGFATVEVYGGTSDHPGRITNNVFSQLQIGLAALYLEMNCGARVFVYGNRFEGNTRGLGQCSGNLKIYCQSGQQSGMAQIEGNVFDAVQDGWLVAGEGVTTFNPAEIRENTFVDMSPDTVAAVWVADSRSFVTENNFISTAHALCKYSGGGDSLDARFNWWGDASGPYDPVLNPEGRGAEILCNHDVLIQPWLDSTFIPNTARQAVSRQPVSLALVCSPNPFNPITQFRFDLAIPGMVNLTIYDLLGRKVTELLNRRIEAGAQQLEWNAKNSPSGVYFAVLRTKQGMGIQKLVLLK